MGFLKNLIGSVIKGFVNNHIKDHIESAVKTAVTDALEHTEVSVNPATKEISVRYRKEV